jgi:hypothetical protein
MNYNKDNTPEVVERCHQCLLWFIPALDKMPRNRRFTLGEKLELAMLEVLGLCTQAVYQKDRRETLSRANQQLAIARHLWRLAFELNVIDKRRYRHGSDLLVDIGRQIGGWYKVC